MPTNQNPNSQFQQGAPNPGGPGNPGGVYNTGGQQPGYGRYVPPTLAADGTNPNNWNQSNGPYSYNVPNSFGGYGYSQSGNFPLVGTPGYGQQGGGGNRPPGPPQQPQGTRSPSGAGGGGSGVTTAPNGNRYATDASGAQRFVGRAPAPAPAAGPPATGAPPAAATASPTTTPGAGTQALTPAQQQAARANQYRVSHWQRPQAEGLLGLRASRNLDGAYAGRGSLETRISSAQQGTYPRGAGSHDQNAVPRGEPNRESRDGGTSGDGTPQSSGRTPSTPAGPIPPMNPTDFQQTPSWLRGPVTPSAFPNWAPSDIRQSPTWNYNTIEPGGNGWWRGLYNGARDFIDEGRQNVGWSPFGLIGAALDRFDPPDG